MEDTDENIELILAQWQTCVEMANTVSQRRDAMNNIFNNLKFSDYNCGISYLGTEVTSRSHSWDRYLCSMALFYPKLQGIEY